VHFLIRQIIFALKYFNAYYFYNSKPLQQNLKNEPIPHPFAEGASCAPTSTPQPVAVTKVSQEELDVYRFTKITDYAVYLFIVTKLIIAFLVGASKIFCKVCFFLLCLIYPFLLESTLPFQTLTKFQKTTFSLDLPLIQLKS
jgi:hypothetical protein